ncbi:MAG: AsmA family protein, partial [Prolixibacteraceae bacterium]
MDTIQSGFRKLLKAFLWIALSFILLFLILAGLIQIPSIQTRIVQYATTLVSNKTHTKVEIEHISISFPKSVVIEGIYLEDLQEDTLLYAGKAKINITLSDFIKNKISISSLDLEDATVKLHSTLTDPLFNYNFLLTAFADTTSGVKSDTLTASKWKFSLDQVSLKNVRFTYHDEYTGMNVFAVVKNSEFNVDEINLEKSSYQIDELTLDGLLANVRMTETGNRSTNNPESVLPKVGAGKLQLRN